MLTIIHGTHYSDTRAERPEADVRLRLPESELLRVGRDGRVRPERPWDKKTDP